MGEKTKNSERPKSRDIDTDIMRIIATFFVVLIHSSGFDSYPAIFLNSISRFSVPIFVLISGSYFLRTHHDIKRIVRKCAKLFSFMIIWSAIYFIFGIVSGEIAFEGIKVLAVYLFTEPIHLWFLYALIGLYLLSPLFYFFCAHASKSEHIYILTLTFVFGSIIMIALRTDYVPVLAIIIYKMKIDVQLGFLFCYIAASFIRRFEVRAKVSHVSILFIASSLLSFVGTLYAKTLSGAPDELFLSFFSPTVLIGGVAFYLMIKEWISRSDPKSLKLTQTIVKTASLTFGTYLIHPLIIKVLDRWMFHDISSHLHPMLYIPIKAFIIFTVSLVCIFIAKFLQSKLRKT